MNSKTSIKIKATLLITLFSLNSVFGFACSMGLDMGYNKSHHTEEATEVSVHAHGDGKKHLHNKKEKKVTPVHVHADGKKHHHENEPKKSHHDEPAANHHDKKEASKKDDCCTNEIMQFQQSDKNLAAKTGINMPVFVAIINIFLGIDRFSSVESTSQQYIASYFHPPPPDIRIAIQSFQI